MTLLIAASIFVITMLNCLLSDERYKCKTLQ